MNTAARKVSTIVCPQWLPIWCIIRHPRSPRSRLPAALAAKTATASIPIVFTTIGKPVEIGLVPSLSRPSGKRHRRDFLERTDRAEALGVDARTLPAAKDMALLLNPNNPTTENQWKEMQVAAHALGLQLQVLHASSEDDFDAVFARAGELRSAGLVIGGDILFTGNSDKLAKMALRQALPAIFQGGTFAAAGGIMDYGGDFAEANRLAGVYTGRILKGEKPADLPVQQATKVQLVVNVNTANALGITVPLSLLGRADEVIE
ncbi:ABC transporter substrate-binding protein [Bradyrhizobium sp. 143]|nr:MULTISPECIES: ABC transporter substrate-binding protein [unclassified Bradyrhizobium]MCK1709531.1 ABC transporter substrate-binding protein [Bradyrhizobium sp. 143]